MNTSYGSIETFVTYTPNVVSTLVLTTNVTALAAFAEADTQIEAQAISIHINLVNTTRYFVVISTYLGEELVDKSNYPCDFSTENSFDVRFFIFNGRISIYINSKWVYSYAVSKIVYPSEVTQSLSSLDGDIVIHSVRKVELSDGREAVYIDYEQNSDNAISSIIQERPIEQWAAIGRSTEFTYDATKDIVETPFVSTYDETIANNSQLSSDGLVYSMDVGISLDAWVAEHVGFITRLYRMPELDSGVERAVSTLQKKARQSRNHLSTIGRFNPLMEISDIQFLNAVVISGTNRIVTDQIIVEDISMSIQDGDYRQNTNGRRLTNG